MLSDSSLTNILTVVSMHWKALCKGIYMLRVAVVGIDTGGVMDGTLNLTLQTLTYTHGN